MNPRHSDSNGFNLRYAVNIGKKSRLVGEDHHIPPACDQGTVRRRRRRRRKRAKARARRRKKKKV